MSGGLVMLKPSIVSATWTSQRGRPVRASRQTRAASLRADEQPMPEDRDAAVHHVGLPGIADLLLTRVSPDLPPGAGVHRGDRSRVAAARRIHHAVDDERRALAGAVAGHRRRPRGSKPGHVRRSDGRQRGVVRALVIAPVHQPVVRLGCRRAEALVGHTAGNRRRGRGLAQVPRLQRAEIRHQVLDLVGR